VAHPIAITLISGSAAISASGNSAAVDLVAADTADSIARRLARLTLSVTASTGSPALVVKVQTSLDGTTGWHDVPYATFEQKSGSSGLERLLASPVERYIRAAYSFSGTGSITIKLDGYAEAVYADPDDFSALGLPAALAFDQQIIRRHLLAATATANGLISSQRVKLPLRTPYPEDLVHSTCAIAGWTLLKHRGFDPENAADAEVKAGHDNAIDWLRDWRDGRVAPDATDDTPDTDEGDVVVDSDDSRGWAAF
jgi:phage gp36-like protein